MSRASQAMSLSNDLARLAVQVPMLDASRAGAELYGAPRLNAFSLFRPNENALSQVLADLLSPRGTHGQGILFLQSILEELKLPGIGVHEVVTVRREVMTSARRRIDLLVETPRMLIGIENKPWADQQNDQLIDYHHQLQAWAGQRQAVLIFLSNQSPRTAEAHVLTLPYLADSEDAPSLRRALTRAIGTVKAARARMHAEEFVRFIDLEFEDEGVTDELDQPYIEAVRTELSGTAATRKAIAMVMLANEVVYARIVDELGSYLEKELALASGGCLRIGGTLTTALAECEPWGFRRESWPEHCIVGISSSEEYSGVHFGVRAPDPIAKGVRTSDERGCAARELVDRAVRRVGGGRKTVWWPWWQYAEPSHWGNEFAARLILGSPSGKVADNPDAQDLARRLIELFEAIDEESKNATF